MGLFENPFPAASASEWPKLIHTPEALQLARELDRESIVLLENHDNTLPLKKSGNIAVIGPMAYGFMNVCPPCPIPPPLLRVSLRFVSKETENCVYENKSLYLKVSNILITDCSTAIMSFTVANTGVSPLSMGSKPPSGTKLPSTMFRDANDGVTTSLASLKRLLQQRNQMSPLWW
jgi:beta-glucosidase-like glycosyl hydrolase